jgi:DNA primase
MQEAKEEVRARLNIEDVVSEYVQLKRAGRNFKGLSPFTSERTPSFVVSPEKHIWHDFSSGKGGDVFSFVMEVEGIDFRAALEQLARKAGVDLSQYDSKQSGDIAKKKKRLLEANELAARYYQQCLLKNQHALEYVFKTRALSKEIVSEFRIGYAPDEGSALIRALEKRGFNKKELADAGLTNRYGGDIFRGRMTVPLMDGAGQVIGFTGRIIGDDPNAPKYLNTPATLIYDKSRHVFGLSQAKEAIRKSDTAVIVEGNLDVVSSHQAGVKHVVATAGTAMTEWHLKALSRLSQHVKLAFDGDKAGLAATERAIPIAQTVGVELKIVSLPESAKDPDELIQQGVVLWERAIEQSQPVVDWILDQYSAREDLTSAAGKRQFTTAGLTVLRSIQDSVEVDHYIAKIAKMTDSSHDAIVQKFNSLKSGETARQLKQITQQDTTKPDGSEAYQDNLLAVLLLEPSSRQLLSNEALSTFRGEDRQNLAAYLQTLEGPYTETPRELKDSDTYVKIVELKAETRYVSWTESDLRLEAARLLRHMEIEHKKQKTDTLLQELRDAELEGDDVTALRIRTKLHELIKETGRG